MCTQEIIKLYTEEGYSLTKLKEKFNYSSERIKTILRENNVHIRTRSEQTRLTNQQRGKKVDHQYFDCINAPEKAWLLGFLAADGTIDSSCNRIKIGLSSIDREILVKIQSMIQSERKILDYESNQGFAISELVWSSANHKQQLAKYFIVPKKTYKEMHLPLTLSQELQLAFLLGYYDGDGCFKDDDNYCRFEICSYRPELLEDFSKLIEECFQIQKTVYKDKSRANYYTLTYSTEEAITILNRLYTICPNCSLLRKKEKFNNWLEKNNRI